MSRIPLSCFRKRILLLMVWTFLFGFPRLLLVGSEDSMFGGSSIISYLSEAFSLGVVLFAPFFGWLADAKLGRYKTLVYGALALFVASILFSVALLVGDIVGKVLTILAMPLQSFGASCSLAVMLPFMSDQLVVTGASSDELSAVVYWFYWIKTVIQGLGMVVWCEINVLSTQWYVILITFISAVGMALVIISDCLCQQWLYTAHKPTNPIKLIIQVLNYTRKHSYPERRSAFTFIDEEHPARIDYGKEKFGGPFLEEEVEDVKTMLRLLPLVGCISLCVSVSSWSPNVVDPTFTLGYWDCVLGSSVTWISPLLLIPLYQFLLYPLLHRWVPSMLKRIGIGLFLQLLGYVGSVVMRAFKYSGDLKYLSCGVLNITSPPTVNLEWYWSVPPSLTFCIGRALVLTLVLEFCIAQSPDKMKGLVIGAQLAFTAVGQLVEALLETFLKPFICLELTTFVLLSSLFVVYLFLAKRYKLRIWNIVINIPAIVFNTYDRYFDQEEEYMRERARLLQLH